MITPYVPSVRLDIVARNTADTHSYDCLLNRGTCVTLCLLSENTEHQSDQEAIKTLADKTRFIACWLGHSLSMISITLSEDLTTLFTDHYAHNTRRDFTHQTLSLNAHNPIDSLMTLSLASTLQEDRTILYTLSLCLENTPYTKLTTCYALNTYVATSATRKDILTTIHTRMEEILTYLGHMPNMISYDLKRHDVEFLESLWDNL